MPRPKITAPRAPQEKLRVLIPEATRNYIKNPSFKYSKAGWTPGWDEEANFEYGDMSPNSRDGFDSVSNAADCSVVTVEGGIGNYAFSVNNITNTRYGVLSGPDSEDVMVSEFYFYAGESGMGAGDLITMHRLMDGGSRVVRVNLTNAAGIFSVTVQYFNDAGALVGTIGVPVTIDENEWHLVRVYYQRASAGGANDGVIRWYIDNRFAGDVTNADTDTLDITDTQTGTVANVSVGIAGRLLFSGVRYASGDMDFTGVSCWKTTEKARFGTTSLKLVTDGDLTNEGPYFRVDPSTQNTPYAGSIYARGEGVWRVRVKDGFNGDEAVSDPITLNDDRWTRIEDVIGKTGFEVSNDLRLYFETDDDAPQAVTAYIDGAQLEQKLYSTTYADGEQPGCRWNIQTHNSESTRSAETRAGGRWYPLTDEEIYVTVWSGGGTPPLRNNTQDFGQAPGAFFQSVKYLSRVLNLTFHVIDPNGDELCAGDSARLAALRRTLWDFIKPDRVKDQQPFWLEYTEGENSLYLEVRYEAGLELETDIRNRWFNDFALRLLSVSPFWEEDDQEVVQLEYQNTFTASFLAARVDGAWGALDTEDREVRASFAEDQQGRVWNTSRANLAGAGDIFLYYYDGDSWTKVPEAINGLVNHIAVDSEGNIWLGGAFTDIGGTGFNYIAYYKPSDGSWNALDLGGGNDGFNDVVFHIEFAPNGDAYICGIFTQDGAGTTFGRIARWDGSSLHPIGPTGINGVSNAGGNTVNSIAISKDGANVYFGGKFTQDSGGNTLRYIAKYTPSDDALVEVGGAFNDTVLEVILDKSGSLYACGDFTTNAAGDQTYNYFARWNGSSWESLGGGLNDSCFTVAIDEQGSLFVVGTFTQAGDVTVADGLARWNGTAWTHIDLNVNGVPDTSVSRSFNSVLITSQGDIFITWSSGGAVVQRQAVTGYPNTVENVGSQEAPPMLWIKGPGHLKWIENQTTDDILYLDYVLLDGEELTIDCAAGIITSTFRGEDYTGLLPQSDFGAFHLLPGDNNIVVFMDNDVDAEVQIRYTPRHATVDAVSANIWDE